MAVILYPTENSCSSTDFRADQPLWQIQQPLLNSILQQLLWLCAQTSHGIVWTHLHDCRKHKKGQMGGNTEYFSFRCLLLTPSSNSCVYKLFLQLLFLTVLNLYVIQNNQFVNQYPLTSSFQEEKLHTSSNVKERDTGGGGEHPLFINTRSISCSALQLNPDIPFYPTGSVKFPRRRLFTQKDFRDMEEHSGMAMLPLPAKTELFCNNALA